MLMTNAEIDDIKGLIAKARKRAVNFAICMGKSPEGTVILGHLKKDPELLARQARKAGETARVAFGVMDVSGKKMLLTCPDDPPAGIAKRTKAFLMQIKMPMKVVFLGTDGTVLEDDGEDEPDKTAAGMGGPETPQATAGNPDHGAAWAKVEASITPLVQALVARGVQKAAQVQTAWDRALASAETGDFAAAISVAAKLKPIVISMAATDPPEAKNQDPAGAKWAAVQPAISALYEQAMALTPENAAKLRAAWAMASEKADGADFMAALKVAARLKPALEAVIAAGPTKPAVAAGTVAFQKSRVMWVSARSNMMAEVQKLAAAIDASAEGDDLADEIRAASAEIVAEVSQIDTRLQDALDELTNADDAKRSALRAKAAGILVEYQRLLDSGIFKRIDDNPFTPVNVAAGARSALSVIARTLAA